ncbi:MAG TPA: DoxX family protein [Candidatus Paceibacterota bacterium]|jgi:putative oxidoreductase|nr:DoxX family protein [Candidatus Paceibacterota bacterium]
MIHKVTRFVYHKSMGMLLVRLASGYIFANHGWMKLQNLKGTSTFFAGLGLPPGTAAFIAIIEVVGGIMLILGIAPRLAALILGIEMIVALVLVSIPHGSFELEILLAAAAFAVFFMGAGAYSLYSMERE